MTGLSALAGMALLTFLGGLAIADPQRAAFAAAFAVAVLTGKALA
jgi:hypothetical protein